MRTMDCWVHDELAVKYYILEMPKYRNEYECNFMVLFQVAPVATDELGSNTNLVTGRREKCLDFHRKGFLIQYLKL